MSEIADNVSSISRQGSRARVFFVTMGLVFLLSVLIGFGPTFFLRPLTGATDYLGGPAPVQVPYDESTQLTIYPGGPLPAHLLLHGLALTLWYVLFIMQAWLVAAHRVTLHRRFGVAGIAVGGAVIVTSIVTMIRNADRSTTIGLPAQAQIGVLVGETIVLTTFAVLLVCGACFRRRPALHKRTMFLAALSLIGPALSSNRPAGRAFDLLLPEGAGGVGLAGLTLLLLCLVALFVRDVAIDKRVQPATAGAILIFFGAAGIAAAAIFVAGGPIAYVEWVRSL